MRGEIICIGDELISGRVAEKNARYAAARLWPLGIAIQAITLVGDDIEAIKDCLGRAMERSRFVLVTGGLGATEDDITAQAAAELFKLPLAESRRMVKNLREFWRSCGEEVPAQALKMAWLPQGAEVLSASSAGFCLPGDCDKPVYFLPGVPAETRRLLDKKVIPALIALQDEKFQVVSNEIRVFGIGEADLQTRLEGVTRGIAGASLGYYPEYPEVALFYAVRSESAQGAEQEAARLEKEIHRRLGDLVVAAGGETLEQVVGRLLAGRGLNLCVAESCTGGLIGHRLTQAPGSSAYFLRGLVVYSNQAKQELLGVRDDTLKDHGAVSPETAREMALGAVRSAASDLGLAVTGIAGPDGGSEEKPVGTVHFALAAAGQVHNEACHFQGSRRMIKAQAAEYALNMLRLYLSRDNATVHGA